MDESTSDDPGLPWVGSRPRYVETWEYLVISGAAMGVFNVGGAAASLVAAAARAAASKIRADKSGVPPPKTQYYGGNKEDEAHYAKRDAKRINEARKEINSRQGILSDLSHGAAAGQEDVAGRAIGVGDAAQSRASEGHAGYLGGMSDAEGSRGGILRDARKLEGLADRLPGSYSSTAAREAALSRSANARSAMGIAASSGGGQLAIRNAIGAASDANTDAALRSDIIRAKEMNDLNSQQAGMYASAAGIRTNVGSQDINRANVGAQVAAQGTNSAVSALGTAGAARNAGSAAQMEAGKANLAIAANQEQAYLGAQAQRETAQLIAARESELAAAAGRRSAFGSAFDPPGLVWK